MNDSDTMEVPKAGSLDSGQDENRVHLKGTLYEITLENFMCYDALCIRPSPGLNILTGPNGCGKSSIFLATMLALGGDLSFADRQLTLGELVRFGGKSDHAEITVKVINKEDVPKLSNSDFFEVKVKITRTNEIFYEVNGTSATKSELEKSMKEMFNISTENLTQFLAQDTVRKFSTSSSKYLLEACLSSFKGAQMKGKLDSVTYMKNQTDSLVQSLELARENLAKDEEIFQKNMKLSQIEVQRNELRKNLLACQYQRNQLVFQRQANIIHQNNERKEKLAIKLTDLTIEIENVSILTNQIKEAKTELEKKIHQGKFEIRQTEMEHQLKKTNIEDEIQRLTNLVDKLSGEHTSKFQEQQMHMESISIRISELSSNVSELGIYLIDAKEKYIQITKEVCDLLTELDKAENLKKLTIAEILRKEAAFQPRQKKLHALLQRNHSTHMALEWLREERSIDFKKPIHDPLSVSADVVQDFKLQIWNELCEPLCDAFIAEDSDDALKLLKAFKDELSIENVSVMTVKPSSLAQKPNDHLKHGTTTLKQGIYNVPESFYELFEFDRIPVYQSQPESSETDVPFKFYCNNQLNRIIKSKYSGKKIQVVEDVGNSITLFGEDDNPSYDEVVTSKESLDQIEQKIQQLQSKLVSSKETESKALSVKNMIEEKLSKAEFLKKEVQAKKDQLSMFEEAFNTGKLDEMMLKKKNLMEIEFPNLKRSMADFEEKKPQKISAIQVSIADLKEIEEELLVLVTRVNDLSAKKRNFENMIIRCNKTISDAEKTIKELKESSIAQKLEDFSDHDNKVLGMNLVEIDSYMVELRLKLGKLPSVETQNVEKFEKEEHKMIAKRKKVTNLSEQVDKSREELKLGMAALVETIQPITKKVSEKFTSLMYRLGYNGECVFTCDSQDVEDFGLDLMVKFGPNEEFRKLNASVHSGGEKSVATVLFIVALQSCGGQVSIRFLDEINQGMDKKNELEVWNILKDVLKSSSSQVRQTSSYLQKVSFANELFSVLFSFPGPSPNNRV